MLCGVFLFVCFCVGVGGFFWFFFFGRLFFPLSSSSSPCHNTCQEQQNGVISHKAFQDDKMSFIFSQARPHVNQTLSFRIFCFSLRVSKCQNFKWV